MLLMLVKMLAMPIACFQYAANKDYIVAKLCVNKAKPMLHCNGQCVLAKKLAKANDSNESSSSEKGSAKIISAEYFEEKKDISFGYNATTPPTYYHSLEERFVSEYTVNIFHPPA